MNSLLGQVANNSIIVSGLNSRISELEKSIAYYEQYISQLETGEQVVATFEYDGSVYNIQIVNKGSKLSVTSPTNTEYKIFNGWKVDEEFIDLDIFTITQNTKIVADVIYKYDVKFSVNNEIISNQIVLKDGFANLPETPIKDGYDFVGWTLDGINVIDVANYTITGNTIFVAKFVSSVALLTSSCICSYV